MAAADPTAAPEESSEEADVNALRGELAAAQVGPWSAGCHAWPPVCVCLPKYGVVWVDVGLLVGQVLSCSPSAHL